ncbi:hypothetical protein HBI56_007370 [Parastagonospora nodorum]|uniref:Uncharacterized protein n=1 Tax=Phaeosphaeria nodorum (strain SN15 / ATCC MYA-4574 / FGSC 10173) TaxID=321614 RepID=A0A7U2ER24_PHANO|nr:hypothetical protein HBH56_122340 [Parastagonospora nodorum]QRC91042.1 hypothetical protein JI435_400910 [Parastagonospora nodorum SN15]KAH3935290.1 hypothetical protein HBH54_047890 [Parastagonospora nodorum]KAH3950225.1 hypothetical protein HBH53_076060 [Parastagonospora nodorum]KAH3987144.1 hypothetical protein HBH51_009150 [Parastagonospora nodorum]
MVIIFPRCLSHFQIGAFASASSSHRATQAQRTSQILTLSISIFTVLCLARPHVVSHPHACHQNAIHPSSSIILAGHISS